MNLPIYNSPILNLANQEEIKLDDDIILKHFYLSLKRH